MAGKEYGGGISFILKGEYNIDSHYLSIK